MFKNKINIYFFTEIIKSYFLVLVSFSLLIWITQCARLLDLITENGISYILYIKYTFLLIPKVFTQLMPICFLISLFLSIIKLQDNKEIEIYWISGISKKQIINLIIKISLLPTLISLLLYVYFTPLSNLKSREILASSEFSLINSLVKKNNFNAPLKGLTIFVNKNDKKGNLENIYIFENDKTIIATNGRVLDEIEKNYLELSNGEIHEKKNNQITIINFKKTLFDFTKYQNNLVRTPKFQERDILWLINNFKSNKITKERYESLYEINKRFLTPLLIPLISIFSCFLLLSNSEKYNLNKIKFYLFAFTTTLIIFYDVVINFVSKNENFVYFLYLFPIISYFFFYHYLNYLIRNEPINK